MKLTVDGETEPKHFNMHAKYGPKRELKAVIRFVPEVVKKDKHLKMPYWTKVIGILTLIAISLFLAASLYVEFGKQPAGLYGESCIGRSCTKGLGLKCINGKCQCESNQYYSRGCTLKLKYLDKCRGNTSCLSNMVCADGVCKCNSEYYWDSQTCQSKRLYYDPCNTDRQCSSSRRLYCDRSRLRCRCILNSTWDGYACWSKMVIRCAVNYTWNTALQACSPLTFNYGQIGCVTDTWCNPNTSMICNTGSTCNCPTTSITGMCDCMKAFNNESFWNGSACQPALSYGKPCYNQSTSYMCQTLTQGTLCSSLSGSFICDCPYLQYFDGNNNSCKNQVSFNQTCTNTSMCQTVFGLTCVSGRCNCPSSITHFWNGTSCRLKKTFADPCNNTFECNFTAGLVCSALSNQTCDCFRGLNNESYWNGNSCQPTMSFGEYCNKTAPSSMCQTFTQGTLCNITCTAFTCQCPYLSYFDAVNNVCKSQLPTNSNCSNSLMCRIPLGSNCVSQKCT